MNWKQALCGAALLALMGCSGFEPFQPNPFEYEEWSKFGSSEDDVVSALLECGHTHPRGPDRSIPYEMSANDVALVNICMKGQGFVFDSGRYDFCKEFSEPLPACQPNTVPPKPDREKRLNSLFCRQYPKAKVCRF